MALFQNLMPACYTHIVATSIEYTETIHITIVIPMFKRLVINELPQPDLQVFQLGAIMRMNT